MSVSCHFERFGEGERSILISPGLTQTIANWRTLCRQNPQYSWVVFDPRGQGKSPLGPRPYQLDHHVEDLLTVLESCQLKRPLLAGFSHGGRVALRAAARHGPLFAGLLLVSSATWSGPWRKATIRSWYECLKRGGLEALAWCSLPIIVGPRILNKFEDPEFLVRGTVHRNSSEGLLALFEGMKGYPPVEEDLKCLDLPLLFLRGGQDLLVTERDLQILLQHQAAARHACQDECGHTVALEDPVWFMEQIERFFPAGSRPCHETPSTPAPAAEVASGPSFTARSSP